MIRLSVGLSIVLLILVIWSAGTLPSYQLVRANFRPSDVWVVDRNGMPLESLRTTHSERSLDWVTWNEISPAFKTRLIQVEDKRFYQHHGVDILALANAIRSKLSGASHRGASTISMQLVSLLTKQGFRRKNLFEKIDQIIQALKLELSWDKDEILEVYVNLLPFRGELKGIRAASFGLFKKAPLALDDEEASLLIALVRSPNAAIEKVAKRACLILQNSECHPMLELAQNTLLTSYSIPRSREVVPVMNDGFVLNKDQKSLIKTSLDLKLQQLAISTLRDQLKNLKNQNVHDGAILILDTKTGEVLSYVGNAGPGFSSAFQVDGVRTKRQAGSTIKPFVYATAFENRILNPDSLLEDSPADISVGSGRVYHPKNYDHRFRGYVSAAEALASSINVPAVRALELVGLEKVIDKLKQLGFKDIEDEDFYGPSLALGTMDITLWDLTHSYRKLADNPEIFNILSQSEYRRFTFGLDSVLSLPFLAAVKTGTSKDMRDNWCIGWTENYTVGVWIGNFNGSPMWNVSGVSGAAPIWRQMMLALHPNPSSNPGRYYQAATPLLNRTISRIRYPAPNMLLGLDPDIPQIQQKLPIEIENPQTDQSLFINNKKISDSLETLLVPLERGKFHLELKTAQGETLDQVHYEVR